MDLLVLGGTGFVGRALVDEGLARGWTVTTLNRGTRAPITGVTALTGDRTTPEGLAALGDRRWDVVADTWSWAPSAVRDSAAYLAERANRYVYMSSRSVYAYPAPAGADETAHLVEASSADTGYDDYARAKAGAEAGVTEAFGDRGVLLRPGLILGPHEDIGRLPWWLSRIARGGTVLAPGDPTAGIQYVDARDLARFALIAGGRGLSGPFNVVTPVGATTMGDLLGACVDATGSPAQLHWVGADTVLAAGIEPWMDLPVWLPPGDDHESMHGADVTRALDAGLTFRPVGETVADTWAWLQSIGGVAPQRADRPVVGLPPEREAALLASL
ncbi:MAG: NAD-dependent epimerase/dehydratase family protein [Mycetocola sp.]